MTLIWRCTHHLIGYGGVYVHGAVAYHVGSATVGQALHPRVVEYIAQQAPRAGEGLSLSAFRRLLPR